MAHSRTMAVLAYAQPRPTRDAGGTKHATTRFGAATAFCGTAVAAYGEPAPPQRPAHMCGTCAASIYD
ncbi:hypothetical protein HDA40_001940 [Hamadaea flava]|uniref:Uncharacterized protein n=1 Tax=Hamadaea flava TaxID=1742688 RepID=A0ABV8LDT1_9ACTN|nr:hypothetical protein [Hamadaea flava]MCP2323433.1 hypothetical protein [Hamadaea flava]